MGLKYDWREQRWRWFHTRFVWSNCFRNRSVSPPPKRSVPLGICDHRKHTRRAAITKKRWSRLAPSSALELFTSGVKANQPTAGFYDSRSVILAWFEKAKRLINPSADCGNLFRQRSCNYIIDLYEPCIWLCESIILITPVISYFPMSSLWLQGTYICTSKALKWCINLCQSQEFDFPTRVLTMHWWWMTMCV